MAALGHTGHVSLQNIPAHFIVERITEFGMHLKARSKLSVHGEGREVCSTRASHHSHHVIKSTNSMQEGEGREGGSRVRCMPSAYEMRSLPACHDSIISWFTNLYPLGVVGEERVCVLVKSWNWWMAPTVLFTYCINIGWSHTDVSHWNSKIKVAFSFLNTITWFLSTWQQYLKWFKQEIHVFQLWSSQQYN